MLRSTCGIALDGCESDNIIDREASTHTITCDKEASVPIRRMTTPDPPEPASSEQHMNAFDLRHGDFIRSPSFIHIILTLRDAEF